jgi:hypothetical protein
MTEREASNLENRINRHNPNRYSAVAWVADGTEDYFFVSVTDHAMDRKLSLTSVAEWVEMSS